MELDSVTHYFVSFHYLCADILEFIASARVPKRGLMIPYALDALFIQVLLTFLPIL